ncbi:MAG: SDR family oxidoreductase [Hormoscilla sp. GUM202]|nr:SDR family oxidoreductase [Hormoscilla sp. GUM202]
MDLGLAGKKVLVTGSTAGIGNATARAFLREGAKVFVNGRSSETVEATVKELSQQGEVVGIVADVGTAVGTDKIYEEIIKQDSLDVLINNVGIFGAKEFVQITDEEWLHYFNVNVMSAVRLSRSFLPPMVERNSGRIMLIASETGVKPYPDMIHYSMTKTALIGLARGMAELTKGTNVTVNSILPGPTWTEGVEKYFGGISQSTGQSISELTESFFKTGQPSSLIQRFARVEEVADTIVFLSSAKASAINGAAQRVEGGIIRSSF